MSPDRKSFRHLPRRALTFYPMLSYTRTSEQEGLCPVMKDERLATPEEISDFLGVPLQTLAKWRSQDIGPSYFKLVNGRVRYRMGVVAEWLASQAVGTTEQGVA